ncbi:tRNA uridine(34) 5-carboxymethylaminomethyl modification radical SAM/GNAT enzyme Elp3 [bacterium]|nr:tRNA uridine(34) 5-carboxymethylaminomethyl modification radical SAM/GNAT enzyme Elp3 [bacterium]
MIENYKTKRIADKIIKELIRSRIKRKDKLDSFKRKIAKKYKIPCPSNVELLKIYHKLVKNKSIKPVKIIENLLRKRPVRSLSGIVNVSVLTKPFPCPGKCIFCPQQKNLPKSYLKGEPAVQRAISTNFNPYLQIQTRLESLEKTGHPIDKIELRIIGGTWSYYPRQYQSWFIKECFRACNEFPSKKQIRNNAASHIKATKRKLKEQQRKNEKAKCRIVGITIETRPDYITIKEIKTMRELGVTRVELGIQSIYNDVLKLVKRGHNISSTIKATQLLKDAGFKVSYQVMPNLPGSNFQRDVKMFREIFQNQNFQPDLLKIYPLALIKSTPLYKWYLKKKFVPYSKKELTELLIEIKKQIPYYCRIQRVVRDIPSKDIVAGGAKVSNLREIAQKEMKKRRLKCHCIRCREVKSGYKPKEKIYLYKEQYSASGGREIFLSFENKQRTKLYALLRLRIPSPSQRILWKIFPALKNASLIREIHTYGQMLPIGKKSLSPQHKGLGKKLMSIAENITKKESNFKKVAVISGVGVRGYYRKLGYRLKDTYMIKAI